MTLDLVYMQGRLTSSSAVTRSMLSGSPTRPLHLSELTYPAFEEHVHALCCLATTKGDCTYEDAIFSRQAVVANAVA